MGKIGFVTSPELTELTSDIPKVRNRSQLVQSLIDAYQLTDSVDVIDPIGISGLQLTEFHSKDYIEVLSSYDETTDVETLQNYGLVYDCPPFANMFDTVCAIGGASIDGAESLGLKLHQVVINWYGGWHHGQPGKAEGFCYVNDCVLAIKHLRHYFDRVLYIDLDLHHGNGVEDTFYHSPYVMTYSIHKLEAGFYPGSGTLDSVGEGKGKGYSINIPLKDGASDHTLRYVVDGSLDLVMDKFSPDAIVCQCGADGIAGDPHQAFTYTPEGISCVVRKILAYSKPTLLLGGGGYNFANVARTWTKITADITGKVISDKIPDHAYFCEYGPGFEMTISPGNKRDTNDKDYLLTVVDTVRNNINTFL